MPDAADAFAQLAERRAGDAMPRFEAGVAYHAAGDHQKALHWLREAAKLEPSQLAIHREIAQLSVSMERFDEAIEAYLNLLKVDPRPEDSAEKLAELCMRLGREALLVDALKDALRRSPRNAKLLHRLASARRTRHSATTPKRSKPSSKHTKPTRSTPARCGCWHGCISEAGKYADVARVLQEWVLGGGASVTADDQMQLARAYQATGKADDAAAFAAKVVERAPDNLDAQLLLAQSDLARGRHEDAAARFEQILQARQDLPDAFYGVGVAYRNLKRFGEGIRFLKEALRLRPDHAETCIQMGLAHEALKKYDEALEAYRQATRLEPTGAEGFFRAGVALQGLRKLEESVAPLQTALQLDRKHPTADYFLAVSLLQLGRTEEGVAAFEDAVAKAPQDAPLRAALALGYQKLNRNEEAAAAYSHAIRLGLKDVHVQLNRGKLRQTRKAPRSRRSVRASAARRTGTRLETQRRLGEIYTTPGASKKRPSRTRPR